MKTCPNPACPDLEHSGVSGEYIDSVEICPRCGTRLAAGPEAGQPDQPGAPPEGFMLAARISEAALIPLAKSVLQDAAIQFYTRNEIVQDLFGVGRLGTGFNPIVGPVEFWVQRSALAEATELLEGITVGQAATEDLDQPGDDRDA
jgi:hypothetical protein